MLVTLPGTVKEVGEEQPCIRVLVAVSIIALQLSRLSYIEFPSSTTILVNESQPANAASPMLVTFLGIKTLVNKEHLEKAKCLMLVTLPWIGVDEEQPFIRVLVAVSIIAGFNASGMEIFVPDSALELAKALISGDSENA